MDEKTRNENIQLTEKMIKNADIPDVYFWEGYLAGLKSYDHDGPEEHNKWMSYFQCRDIKHHSMGIGYRMGYSGAHFTLAERNAQGLESAFEAFIKVEEEWDAKPPKSNTGCLLLIAAIASGTASFLYLF